MTAYQVGTSIMSESIKVLFVCVHNAARSRMAEAFLRQLGGPRFEVSSSGFEPREVNPLVIEAMARVGVTCTGGAASADCNHETTAESCQLLYPVCAWK